MYQSPSDITKGSSCCNRGWLCCAWPLFNGFTSHWSLTPRRLKTNKEWSDAGCFAVAVQPFIILLFVLCALCSYLCSTWTLICLPYLHFRDSGVLLIDSPVSHLHSTVFLLVARVTDSFPAISALRHCHLCDCEEQETAGETSSILHFGKQQRWWENKRSVLWVFCFLNQAASSSPSHFIWHSILMMARPACTTVIFSVPGAGSYWRYESSIQKSHNAETRTSRRATSAAKATLNSPCSSFSPFAFFYLSPSISVAIRAAHHSMAQLGHCQTKKMGGRGGVREEWHHPLSLSPMRIRLPDTIVEPPTWLASSRWHHPSASFPPKEALTSSTVSQLSGSQVCNNLFFFS